MVRRTSLAIAALLLVYWCIQPVGLWFKLLAAVIAIISVLRPALGVIVFAAIAPLSTAIASFFGSPRLGAEWLGLTAFAIAAGVIRTKSPSENRTRIGKPALLAAAVAIASAAAMFPAAAASISREQLLSDVGRFQSAQTSPAWGPLFVAFMMAASGVLGWAVERMVRRTAQLAAQIVLAGLVGHAISATQSVDALWRAATRTGDAMMALPHLLTGLRLSFQTDWNAAASAFLLAGLAGFGLARTQGLRRFGVILLLVIVGAGLWITGSRIAIVLAILASVATLGWLAVRKSAHRFALIGGVVVVIVAAGLWLTVFYPEGRNDKVGDTLRTRMVLMKAGLKMADESPLFGIGIDRFYDASLRYVDPATVKVAVTLPENAHNNFIQVLAEQGIVGLLALLWLLFAVTAASARAQVQQPTALRGALLLAMAACVATWLTGHPLLVPEFAFVFWLYAGTLAALSPAPSRGFFHRLAVFVAIAIVLSVPMRAVALRNSANLEYRGVGVSMWQHDDTQRYRNAGSTFALFLLANERPIEVPLRRAPGTPDPLVVTIQIDHKPINRIVIEGDAWQIAQITLPRGSNRFARVDFGVEGPAGFNGPLPDVLVRVGRESAR